MERYKQIERSIITTYRKSVWKRFVSGVNKYKMISEGDKIAVCISGGKDSMLMAKCIQEIQRHGIMAFDAEYIVMDYGYSSEDIRKIADNAAILNIPIKILNTTEPSPCVDLCAEEARRSGCNKLALGQHFDDVIETILMGMLYGARIQTILPKQRVYPDMEIIRPMYMVKEKDIIAWARHNELEFPQQTSEGNDDNSARNAMVKELIKHFRRTNQYIDVNIFNSVQNVNLKTIIGYHDKNKSYCFLDDYDK